MSDDLMAGAQAVEFPEDASSVDFADFHNDGQREVDFQEAMMGEQNMPGGRHDLEPRGFSTQDFAQEQHDITHPMEPQLAPEQLGQQRDYVQQPQPVVEEPNWQQRYGQSENEKGELRRQLAEVMDQMVLIQQQQQMGNVNVPEFFSTTPVGQQPAPTAVSQPQRPQFDPSQLPRLVGKEDGEAMLAEDVDALLRNTIAPVIYNLEQQTQAAQQSAQLANQRMYESEKARLGISQQEERQLVAQNPWLSGMRDPQSYLQALGNAKRQADLRQQMAAAPQQAQPARTTTPQQQQAVRQRTFVEQGRQAAGPAQADSSVASPQQRFQQQWLETMKLPYGAERARKQRDLMRAGGIQQFTGYRDPQILTS